MKMKKLSVFLAVVCTFCMVASAHAGRKVKALSVFPYASTIESVPLYDETTMEEQCTTEIIGGECINADGIETTTEVPYSGTVGYQGEVTFSGNTPFSGEVPYSGTVQYSGTKEYSGVTPYSGVVGVTADVPYSGSENYTGEVQCAGYAGSTIPVIVEGTVPFSYTTLTVDYDECSYAILVGSGITRMCNDVNDKVNCCWPLQDKIGQVIFKCYGVDPSLPLEVQASCPTTAISEETINVEVPFSKTVNVQVPAQSPYMQSYSGTASYSGVVPYAGSVQFSGHAAYNGTVSYSGEVPYNGVAQFNGEAPFSGAIPYAGSAGYSGSVPFTYLAHNPLVTQTEAVATIDCPTAENVETRLVKLDQLVTKACVGDTINVRGTGYAYPKADGGPEQVVTSRFSVFYSKPGKSGRKKIYTEDRQLADINEGEFKEERQFTFELPGTYTFKYWVYNRGTPVGLAKEKTIEVSENCVFITCNESDPLSSCYKPAE